MIAGAALYYFVFFRTAMAREEIILEEEKIQQEKDKQTQELLEKLQRKLL